MFVGNTKINCCLNSFAALTQEILCHHNHTCTPTAIATATVPPAATAMIMLMAICPGIPFLVTITCTVSGNSYVSIIQKHSNNAVLHSTLSVDPQLKANLHTLMDKTEVHKHLMHMKFQFSYIYCLTSKTIRS